MENKEPRIEGVPIRDIQESFWSVGFEFPNSIAVVEEDISENKSFNLVHACPPNVKLNNWKIIELPVVVNLNLK